LRDHEQDLRRSVLVFRDPDNIQLELFVLAPNVPVDRA